MSENDLIEEYQDEIQELRNRTAELEIEKEKLQDEVDDLTNDLADAQTELDSLRNRLSNYEDGYAVDTVDLKRELLQVEAQYQLGNIPRLSRDIITSIFEKFIG